MVPIVFFIPGTPKPQPRARAFARVIGGKAVARVYDPATAEGWKSSIAEAVRPHLGPEPLCGMLRLSCAFYWERPQNHYRASGEPKPGVPYFRKARKGDLDNIIKALKDALTTVRFWQDDACVVQYGHMDMVYTEGAPGSWIMVEEASVEASPVAVSEAPRPGLFATIPPA